MSFPRRVEPDSPDRLPAHDPCAGFKRMKAWNRHVYYAVKYSITALFWLGIVVCVRLS